VRRDGPTQGREFTVNTTPKRAAVMREFTVNIASETDHPDAKVHGEHRAGMDRAEARVHGEHRAETRLPRAKVHGEQRAIHLVGNVLGRRFSVLIFAVQQIQKTAIPFCSSAYGERPMKTAIDVRCSP
jgi:hypothetical protein